LQQKVGEFECKRTFYSMTLNPLLLMLLVKLLPLQFRGKEFVKVMVIGSRKGITSVIKTLHTLRFAEVGEWSPIMPHSESGK
jgi:hypothetical protein